MKSILTIISIIISVISNAQSSANANVSANIVTPISITKTLDMNFGDISVSSTSGGSVILSTSGLLTATGGVNILSKIGNAATFIVRGENNYTYNITLPSSIILSDGSGHFMKASLASNPSNLGMISSGSQPLYIGSVLNISAGQYPGNYSNQFTIIVSYN